jgi:N-acetylglutamate synthase-like GNAT family acetyltransferase
MVVRSFHHCDARLFIELVNAAYESLEALTVERATTLLAPPYFDPKGFFVAEDRNAAVGCVGVFKLPVKGYLEIRYLAVKDAFSNRPVVNSLIEAALDYVSSKSVP